LTEARVSDGTTLHVEQWGSGRAVLMLHAWGLNGEMWTRQFGAFAAAGYQCITFDRRGHGRSDRPHDYSMDRLVLDVVEVADALELSSLSLLGHSLGGLEAAMATGGALRGRVDHLVLSATTTPRLMAGPDYPAAVPREMLETNLAALSSDIGGWLDANAGGYWGVDTAAPSIYTDWTLSQIFATPTPVLEATNRSMIEADAREALSRVECPTLVIHGDADMSAPLAITGEPTHALVRNSELVVVPGAGHGLYVSYAEIYNEAILKFLAR
jgi:non-heme chloroperoxidase